MALIPHFEPESLIGGDSVAWTRASADYPPAAGYALSYRLLSSDAALTIDGAAVSDDGAQTWTIALTAAETAAYTPGVYTWAAHASKAPDRYTIGTGRICVEPDPATLQTHDARIFAEKLLDALEALLLSKASQDQLSYTIGGTSVARMAPSELEAWRDKYRAEVNRYRAREDLRAGRASSASIKGLF